jgi:hypothetical protein
LLSKKTRERALRAVDREEKYAHKSHSGSITICPLTSTKVHYKNVHEFLLLVTLHERISISRKND